MGTLHCLQEFRINMSMKEADKIVERECAMATFRLHEMQYLGGFWRSATGHWMRVRKEAMTEYEGNSPPMTDEHLANAIAFCEMRARIDTGLAEKLYQAVRGHEVMAEIMRKELEDRKPKTKTVCVEVPIKAWKLQVAYQLPDVDFVYMVNVVE